MTTENNELARLLTKVNDELSKPGFLERTALKYVINDQYIENLPYKAALKRHYVTVFQRLLEIFAKNADHIGWRPATGAYMEAKEGLKPERAMGKPEFEKVFLTALDKYLEEMISEVKRDIEADNWSMRWKEVNEASFSYKREFLSSNLVLTELSELAHTAYAEFQRCSSQSWLVEMSQSKFVREIKDFWLDMLPNVKTDDFLGSTARAAEVLSDSRSPLGYHETRAVISALVQYCHRLFSEDVLGLLATQMSAVVGLKGVKEYLESDRGFSWLEVNLRLMGFGITEEEIARWAPAIRDYLLDMVEIRLMGGAVGPDRAYDAAREVRIMGLTKDSVYSPGFLRYVNSITASFDKVMAEAEHRMPPVEIAPLAELVQPGDAKPLTPSALREVVQAPSFTLTMSELSRLMKLSKLPDNLDPRSTVRLIRNGQGDLQFMIDL